MFNVFLYHSPQHLMPVVHFGTECMCFLSFHVVPIEIPQGFSFLLFLIMTGAVAAQLGYSNPPGLDKLRFGLARRSKGSIFNWYWGSQHEYYYPGNLLLVSNPNHFSLLRKTFADIESLMSRKICNHCLSWYFSLTHLYRITLCYMKYVCMYSSVYACVHVCVFCFLWDPLESIP